MIIDKKISCKLVLCVSGLLLVWLSSIASADGNLPSIPERSSFSDKIDLENYPSLPPPEKAQLMRWDFSEGNVYPYDFRQQTVVSNEMQDMFATEGAQRNSHSMEGNGRVSLKSEQNRVARLVMDNLVLTIHFKRSNGEGTDTKQMQSPPMVIQGIKEDGRMEIGNSSQELLIKTLFPIPPTPLELGQSVPIPASMPFNAMGSLLHVNGSSEIKFADWVVINGQACAKLETDIDISDLNVPAELKGDYACSVKGRSIFYFNVENRNFMSGRIALLISMRMVAPSPRMNFPGENNGKELPETIKMAMDSDNYISVEYLGW